MLPPPLSCKKLVQFHLKLKPKFEGSVVRQRPYPAPQDLSDESESLIKECKDASLVKEYKHRDYILHCSPFSLLARRGSTAMRLVVDYGEVNKNIQNHSRSVPTMENTLESTAKCRFKTKMDKRSGFRPLDLTRAAGTSRLCRA